MVIEIVDVKSNYRSQSALGYLRTQGLILILKKNLQYHIATVIVYILHTYLSKNINVYACCYVRLSVEYILYIEQDVLVYLTQPLEISKQYRKCLESFFVSF